MLFWPARGSPDLLLLSQTHCGRLPAARHTATAAALGPVVAGPLGMRLHRLSENPKRRGSDYRPVWPVSFSILAEHFSLLAGGEGCRRSTNVGGPSTPMLQILQIRFLKLIKGSSSSSSDYTDDRNAFAFCKAIDRNIGDIEEKKDENKLVFVAPCVLF